MALAAEAGIVSAVLVAQPHWLSVSRQCSNSNGDVDSQQHPRASAGLWAPRFPQHQSVCDWKMEKWRKMACLLKNGESVISTAEVVPQQHSIMGLWISTFLLPLQPRGSISFLQLMVFMHIYSPLLLLWSFLHIVSNFLFKFLCLGYLGKFLLSR